MAIGTHIADAMQDHKITVYNYNPDGPEINEIPFNFEYINKNGYRDYLFGFIVSNNYGVPRLAAETRPASLSAYLCIKY
jgi:hypothetical protein